MCKFNVRCKRRSEEGRREDLSWETMTLGEHDVHVGSEACAHHGRLELVLSARRQGDHAEPKETVQSTPPRSIPPCCIRSWKGFGLSFLVSFP